MCSNYVPVTSYDRLLQLFGVRPKEDRGPIETWPTGLGPFITWGPAGRELHDGHFGLVPSFARELEYGRHTYNARSETVHRLRSFRESWAKGWRCLIPADAIFEPYYEPLPNGGHKRPVRHRIQLQGGVAMAIAGIYCWAKYTFKGEEREGWTFAMLTVNADSHPTFQRMHKPGEEKRMVWCWTGPMRMLG